MNIFSHPFVKQNLSLAWPLALNALLMQSMLMIDTLLISPLGELSLAAMGIATTIVAFILGIQIALANGTQLVISRAVGSGINSSISQAFWTGLLINTAVGLLFCLLLTLFEHSIITFLTDNLQLYQQVSDYLSISKYIIIFNALTQVIISLFNGLGKTKIPFKGYLIEMPINAASSYLLIYGYGTYFTGCGINGAAMGSLIAIFARFIYLIYMLYQQPKLDLRINRDISNLTKYIYHHFIEIFPIAANMVILSIGANIYQLLYSQLAINAYAAITLLMPWLRAGTQFITSWALSSAITISQAIGSGKLENLVKNTDICIKIAVAISVVSALFFALFSFMIEYIYPTMDALTYQALTMIAPLYIFLPIIRGYNTVHGHILRALGKTTAVFKINFTGQWIISIPLCALLILYFDCSIFWAFAIQPFEELIKLLPFRYLARRSLANFDVTKFKYTKNIK